MSALRAAALRYAALGLAVFPVHGIVEGRCTCGKDQAWHDRENKKVGKHPATRRGLNDATTTPAVIVGWWNRQPAYNIGIATGPRSGIWVLDEDGPEALAGITALEQRYGALPATCAQRTGRGRHRLFSWDPDGPEIKNSAGRMGEGIDVRGQGGYIIVPPSAHASGRSYAWEDGAAPGEIELAIAPAWLAELAGPQRRPVAPLTEAELKPRQPVAGRATPYGEAAITNACKDLEAARKGSQNTTLWNKALAMGSLYAGREIADASYAVEALRRSGRIMVHGNGSKWSDREEDTLQRGFQEGQRNPRQAPERQRSAPAQPKAAQAPAAVSAAETAQAALDAAGLWRSARGADCGAVRTWLRARGLDPKGLPGVMDRLRAHGEAPIGSGQLGPALLAPLRRPDEPEDAVPEALAILPLIPPAPRFTSFVGDRSGRALVLCWPDDADQVLVAIDLQDAWALGQAVFESGDPMAVVVAPTLSAFAGQPLGDRFGRVMFDMPRLDPERAPWTRAGGIRFAWLAVRHDLRGPELSERRQRGGTSRRRLEGADAAAFWGALAAQGWRAAIDNGAGAATGANPVRLMAPPAGRMGFNEHRKEAV